MGTYQVEASAVVDAPPTHVYGIIADYHQGHQSILPRHYFDEMVVKEGGYGAGTAVYVKMSVFGSVAEYNMVVSEPEPGRVLREEDANAGVVTTFTVEPINQATQSRVTIATTGRVRNGIAGLVERWITTAVSRRIYREELAQLNQVATSAPPVSDS